ncbi:muscle-specific calpain [Penaeus vannamei]|uniref:Muscle-specific calpain n=1 Tax=Penaeus vannamei TaxID=6689 RepID=A0A3R7PC23_PENVA|nr:muscle-specific calpain [Penaeus vannamei]
MVVSLMQKNVRQLKRYGADYQPIGYTIYKLPPEMEPGVKLDTEFFKYNASYAKVPFFLNCREVTTRFRFPAGYYVIVPSTFEPEMTGEFLLRIFTEAKSSDSLFLPPSQPDHPQVQSESILPNGLIVRHAYSITRVTEVDIASAAPKLQVGRGRPCDCHLPLC